MSPVRGSYEATNSVMNRDGGACRPIWTFSRATSCAIVEALVDQRPHHRQQQRHEQRRRAGLAGDVAQRDDDAPVGCGRMS